MSEKPKFYRNITVKQRRITYKMSLNLYYLIISQQFKTILEFNVSKKKGPRKVYH